jgi:hypothetical protein
MKHHPRLRLFRVHRQGAWVQWVRAPGAARAHWANNHGLPM